MKRRPPAGRMVCVALLLGLAPASSALAQRGGRGAPPPARRKECVVLITGVTRGGVTTFVETFRTPQGANNTFAGGGVDAVCEGTDQRLRSDSAEHWGNEKRLLLIGNVHYTEKRLRLDADLLTYYTGEERLVAEGRVDGVTSTGTRFRGPRAEYLRVAPGVRDRSRLMATSRPVVWLSPQDAGASKDSVRLEAEYIVSDNDSLMYARGNVVVERPDLLATADSAFLDNGSEFLRLMRAPKIVGRGERHFTLEGEQIEVFSRKRLVERVKSLAAARATSDDVTLEADTIDLRIADEKLSRAYAWGARRAFAHAREQDLSADSIDVRMPGQQLRAMHAVRRARAESRPDSARVTSSEKDWLQGDTIVALFDSLPARDTTEKPRVRRITSVGTAERPAASWYQIPPASDGAAAKPNINYVTGRRITVEFADGQVRDVVVKGAAAGFYVEAAPDSTKLRASADSAAKARTKRPETRRP